MREVRRVRLLKEMSLDDVYVKTQIPQPKLSRIERGITQPTEAEKRLIAEALQSDIQEIFPSKA